MTYCNFDEKNGDTLGALYNFYVLKDRRGFAPDGWRIPNKKDLEELIAFLGGAEEAGKSLKAQTGWTQEDIPTQGNGNNRSGFAALPSAALLKVFQGGPDDAFNQSFEMWSISSPFSLAPLSHSLQIYASDQLRIRKSLRGTGLAVRLIKIKHN
jgi:uncharacterized protein (TIGR02145 family)